MRRDTRQTARKGATSVAPVVQKRRGWALAPEALSNLGSAAFFKGLIKPCLLIAFLCGLSIAAQQPANPGQIAAAVPAAVTTNAPIAIVPIDANTSVSGALEVTSGKAVIATTGTIAAGAKSTEVALPRRGTMRVCASTTVKLATDTSVPSGETPGLMMALDHGAVETSFATGRNADILLTPDFRILIGAPGASDLKVRLGQHGDTCVDNSVPVGRTDAPYVVVTSVFDGGAYRVQPGQRVMFQHGSLQEVIDNEKEPCGCPPEPRPGSNDFPLAESAGLSLQAPPVTAAPPPAASAASGSSSPVDQPLVYQAKLPATQPAVAEPATPPAEPAAKLAPAPKQQKKSGFFHRVGSFFRKIFGAE